VKHVVLTFEFELLLTHSTIMLRDTILLFKSQVASQIHFSQNLKVKINIFSIKTCIVMRHHLICRNLFRICSQSIISYAVCLVKVDVVDVVASLVHNRLHSRSNNWKPYVWKQPGSIHLYFY